MIGGFAISGVAIIARVPFSNFLPIVFALLFAPFLMYKWANLAFTSSAYIRKNHSEFYEKYKTMTLGTDGKIVDLFAASETEISNLLDQNVTDFRRQIREMRKLIVFSFLGFGALGVLSVLMVG